MVSAPPRFRTFADAVADSKPLMGEGASLMGGMSRAPGFFERVRESSVPVLRAVDPAIDAAVINSSLPDDTAQHAQRMGSRISNRLNPGKQGNPLKDGYHPDQLGPLSDVPPQVGQASVPKPVPKAEPKPSTFDTGFEYFSEGVGKAGYVMMATEMALPAAGWVAGKVGMTGVQNTLGAPGRMMAKEFMPGVTGRQALNDGLQIGFSTIQTVAVAKGAVAQRQGLAEMYADVMGVPVESVSTMALLTGKVPPVLAEARSHYLKEFCSRGLVQAVGWGLMARDLLRGKGKAAEEIASGRIGLTAGIVPGLINMGIDALMGTSTIEVYSGFKKLFESGEKVEPGAYAQFIMAASPDLQKRKVGRQVALELGVEYANAKTMVNGKEVQGTPPAAILREMNDGRFKTRIDRMIEIDEAKLAAQKAAHPQHAQQGKGAMADKVGGNRQQPGKVVGPFTDKLRKESTLQSKELH